VAGERSSIPGFRRSPSFFFPPPRFEFQTTMTRFRRRTPTAIRSSVQSADSSYVDYSIYLVTDTKAAGDRGLVYVVREALEGGVSIVQYREKDADSLRMYETALALKSLCDEFEVPLIINDRVDIALAVDAHGVHVGQSDMPAAVARRLVGKHKIVGVSCKTLEQLHKAEADGADYVGVGPVYGTSSKSDAGAAVGLERIELISQAAKVPVVAIGGISSTNAARCIASGAAGVAVISAIISPDIAFPLRAAADLCAIVDNAQEAQFSDTMRSVRSLVIEPPPSHAS